MELGFLRKTLKVVTIVVSFLEWYCTTQLRFVLGLVRRIDAINGDESTKMCCTGLKWLWRRRCLHSLKKLILATKLAY